VPVGGGAREAVAVADIDGRRRVGEVPKASKASITEWIAIDGGCHRAPRRANPPAAGFA
jgi:hypothetical protein